ncbi:MAG: NAD-dependent epimerase/dehydratase family protein [Ilumatobacter sp.]|uniref:NAD-dependent epimerase/dehydratase family protein n=1 Tax=Ilumatobacter sp. TaxID=1967498 RepID=UPI002629925A|nr:NAD-dependent epimerase/dehydratase family protein [Ilumatobacter sp.]MDJ0767413.1 NAD-dependent epimerase/dehydratase family protein [Ilumatobacter sp.]
MAGMRVLVSGMGGELGSRVASLLEDEPWVGSLEGIDADPPRRRLRRTVFHRIVPGQHDRTVETVLAFNPHVVVHIAVWEPHARAATATARMLTDDAVTSILGAAAECRALESIVVRSGIEIYGRRRGTVTRPSERVPPDPTSDYGLMVADIEETANAIGARIGVTVGALRLATVLGPHVPSALGRVLRMPVVPFSALADPPFAVIHQHDAAEAFVAAAKARIDEPLNIVAPGAITALQAARRGKRIALPLLGPEWALARGLSYLAGSPLPDHVQEMLHRGRLADNARAREVLGFAPSTFTGDVIDQLYGWPSVVHVPAEKAVA